MSKMMGTILPIAGSLIGGFLLGPAGAALGGALGGAGGGAISGQNIFKSAAMGGLQGGIGTALGAFGGGAGAGAMDTGGGQVGGVQVSDPIEAMWQAVQQTGAQGTTQAAQQMGYGSVGDMLTAANPGWAGMTSPAMGGVGGAAPGGSPTGALGSLLQRAGINVPGLTTAAAPNAAGMAAAAGAPGLGPVGTVLGAGSGVMGMLQSLQMQDLARQAGQRTGSSAQAEAQLQALLANPSSVGNMPGFAAGSEAVQRAMAAQGYTGSGNMATALQNYGTGFFNNQAQLLSGLAQAGAPQYGTAISGGMAGANLMSQALGSLGYTAQRGGF